MGEIRTRSRVPEVRSLKVATEVIKNITNIGKTPSNEPATCWNACGCDQYTNFRIVMSKHGAMMISAILLGSCFNCNKTRLVDAITLNKFIVFPPVK